MITVRLLTFSGQGYVATACFFCFLLVSTFLKHILSANILLFGLLLFMTKSYCCFQSEIVNFLGGFISVKCIALLHCNCCRDIMVSLFYSIFILLYFYLCTSYLNSHTVVSFILLIDCPLFTGQGFWQNAVQCMLSVQLPTVFFP